MSETQSGSLLDKLKNSDKAKLIPALIYGGIGLGISYATLVTKLDTAQGDIRDLQSSMPLVHRLSANVTDLKERVTELKNTEDAHYQDLRGTLSDIQRQLYARSTSPTAMPAAAMGPHAALKAME